jgi:transposase
MARKAVSMRKARDILRLRHEIGLGVRQIARSLRVSHGTVVNYLVRAEAAGLGWPLAAEIDEQELEGLLFSSQKSPQEARRPLPAMEEIHKELRGRRRCKGVTLQLLWEEYRAQYPGGYGYTQFCEYYKRFVSTLEPALRQPYKAGEKLFVDWAGETIPVVDASSGEVWRAHLFVAALGASNYTYTEAFENTQLTSWIEAHIHAWEFYGGVASVTVPDNEKTAVTRPCHYEPALHRTYEEMAEHYGTVIIPARPGEPRDKAKVEAAVENAERRILAVLRHETFFSLVELNQAIRKLLVDLNARPFQKMPGSRAELFQELDQPALLPLPAGRYQMGIWRDAKANIDYHVQVDWHCYSVPYQLANQPVEVRLGVRTVEIFYRGKRVAVHERSHKRGGHTTDGAHRPESHKRHLEWTPGRLVRWSSKEVGPQCGQVVATLLESKPHPEQGYRACLGIMRLGRHYGAERLEAACRRAVLLDVCTYRSIKSILATATERRPVPSSDETAPGPRIVHENLRGRDYYAPAEPARDPQEGDSKIWLEPRSARIGDPKEALLLQRSQGILKS